MISTIYMYSYIPSLIVLGIAIFAFFAWTLGTDLYDDAASHFDHDSGVFFIIHLICATVSTVIWFTPFKNVDFLWFLSCFFNTWLSIMLVGIIISTIFILAGSLRKYCLKKRGKFKNV